MFKPNMLSIQSVEDSSSAAKSIESGLPRAENGRIDAGNSASHELVSGDCTMALCDTREERCRRAIGYKFQKTRMRGG